MFHPASFHRKVDPIWERYILIGKSGNYAAKLIMRIKAATYQYPTASIFLQLGNGNSTTFTRVSIEEVADLAAALSEWAKEMVPTFVKASAEAEALQTSLDQAQNLKAVMEAMQNESESYPPNDDDGQLPVPTDVDVALQQISDQRVTRPRSRRT